MRTRIVLGSYVFIGSCSLFSAQMPSSLEAQMGMPAPASVAQPQPAEAAGQPFMGPQTQQPGAPQPGQAAMGQVPEKWEEVQAITQGIDEGRGDWYIKRKYLRRARQVDEQIRTRVQELDEVHKQLLEKYGQQEKRFATAIAELPTKMADIVAAITKVEEEIKQKTAPDAQVTDVDRQRVVDLNDSKKLLTAFKEDFGYLTQLQEAEGKALQIITQQLEQARTYEQQSTKFYEQIDATLSDRIAEQLFLQMQAQAATVEAIIRYFSQDLPQFFETSSQMFDKQRIKVQENFKILVERKLLERPLTEAEKAVNQAIQKGIADAQKAKQEAESTWWGKTLSVLSWPFVTAWNWVRGLWS